jgi:CHRD domain
MKRLNIRVLSVGALGVAAGALLVPGIVGANARRGTGGSQAAQAGLERTFTAVLKGSNETNGGDPDGAGAATITLDPDLNQACVDSVTINIGTVTLTHIHQGAAGVNGPVVVDFAPAGQGALSKCVTPADVTIIPAIIANPAGFYFNVHTSENDKTATGAVRGQFAVHADGAGALHLLPAPLRAYDSRAGTAPTKIAGRETRTVNLWFGNDGAGVSQLAVPPGATGALVTLTATETVAAGYLTLYSADASLPATSTLNWSAADTDIATDATVAVNKTSDVKVTAGPQATHFIIDVIGYYF